MFDVQPAFIENGPVAQADVVLIQEHRMSKSGMRAARAAADKWGWRLLASPARPTEDDSTSGGVGFLVTKGVIGHIVKKASTPHGDRWLPAIIGGGAQHIQGCTASNSRTAHLDHRGRAA